MLEGKLFCRVDVAVPVRGTVNETVDSDRSEHVGLYMDISDLSCILVHDLMFYTAVDRKPM